MTTQTINTMQKSITKSYKVIDSFVNDYCKSEEDKQEFYKALNNIIDLNIEIEKECNQ